MKKILLSLAIISAVSYFSFYLTRAYFTDKKISTGNKFTVGTLNLQVGDNQSNQVESFSISDLGTGEIKGQKIWKIKNTGSLPGEFLLNIKNLLDNENGCNTPEAQVDQTCSDPGTGEGDLGKIISLSLSINNILKITFPINSAGITQLENYWNQESNKYILTAGQESEIKLEWFSNQDYGNEIQSDSLSFDLDFNLQQSVN